MIFSLLIFIILIFFAIYFCFFFSFSIANWELVNTLNAHICTYSATYKMGLSSEFNAQLNDTTRRYTYFVPRDWAWQQTAIEYPSTYKILFMPDFQYNVSETKQTNISHSISATCSRYPTTCNEFITLSQFHGIIVGCSNWPVVVAGRCWKNAHIQKEQQKLPDG